MSGFEKFARSQGLSGDFQRGCNGQYKSDLLHFMEKAFMHQQAEIYRLNNVLAERTKEWLEAIECGTYFENVAKPLKAENDALKSQLSLQRDRNKALETELTSSRNYGDSLQKRIDEYEKLTTSIRNEFNLWTDGREFADVIEAQIENLEALRGERE